MLYILDLGFTGAMVFTVYEQHSVWNCVPAEDVVELYRKRDEEWHSTRIMERHQGFRGRPESCKGLRWDICRIIHKKFDTDFLFSGDNILTHVEDPDILLYLKLGGDFIRYVKEY